VSRGPRGGRGERSGFVPPASLYIHVPVCASKCSYCDFYSVCAPSLSPGFEKELVEATLSRAAVLAERFGAAGFDTVYIGGGTPSLLSLPALERLLGGIENLASRGTGETAREWTMEANPDSLGPGVLEIAKRHGVTRVSIGVQSLDPGELEILGRRHGADAALGALRLAAESGLKVSADLIAGIPTAERAPRQFFDADRLASFARESKSAGASHLSVYDLTIEEGSPLAAARGSLRFPDEDEAWEARRRLEALLGDLGLRRYEVSNYAAPGDECLHNTAYWHMDSYIGAGPGAVSTIALESGASLRVEEPRLVADYRDAASNADETFIELPDAAFESIMMAFRTSFGLDLASFRRRFGIDPGDLIGETLRIWEAWLAIGEPWPGRAASGGPALTSRGMDILNRFLGDCLAEMDRTKTHFVPEKW